MSTETDWYVYRGNQRWGPYHWQQLLEMAQRGELQPSDQLWHPHYPNMVNANQVDGLFSASARSVPVAAPVYPQQTGTVSVCPRCGQIDAVQKVSSIVTGGISTIQYIPPGAVIGHSEATSVSALAQRLMPPTKKPEDLGTRLFKIVLIAIAPGLCGILCVASGLSRGSAGLAELVLGMLSLGISAVLFVLILYSLITGAASRKTAQDKAAHETALIRWNQLYYCYRDDGVFIPGQNRFVPAGQMQTLLYE